MGQVLTCSFLENHPDLTDGKAYTFRVDEPRFNKRPLITKPGKSRILSDAKLVVAIRDELEKYDLIVGHNIRRFDIRFLNARLAAAGERPLKTHFVLDTMYAVDGMAIGGRSLDTLIKFFGLKAKKTPINWEDWKNAAAGNEEALNNVQIHNLADVEALKELYPKVLPYVANLHR